MMLSQFYITLGGEPVSEAFRRDLERVSVENSLHLPDMAILELHDPRLVWVDHELLEPGRAISIAAKSGDGEGLLFDGEIVELEPSYEAETQRLIIRAFDRLHRLDRGRQVRSFVDVTDGDLIDKIAGEVSLRSKVDATPHVHPYVLQANETNLAFLQRRAADLGYLLYVEGETLCCVAPKADERPLELKWGTTMVEFQPRLTTIGQVNRVVARGWDPQNKQAIMGEAQAARGTPQIGIGQHGGELAEHAFHIATTHLVTSTPLRSQAAADLLAQATADRLGARFVEATGKVGGIPQLVAGRPVRVSGVGKRFSGDYFVTSTAHIYDPTEGYTVTFTTSGLHPATLLGLLTPPPEHSVGASLVVGIVTDNEDPEQLGRVKVKFPWLSNEHASDWARVVAAGAGDRRGICCLPEVNDEVLVGFEQGDIHYPYVLGGLWNGRDAPPGDGKLVDGGQVLRRVIRSRSGHTITLDDSDQGGITITDEAGNSIQLDSKGSAIRLSSQGNLTLEAQGDITIEGKANLKLEGQGQVNVKGATINLN